MTLKWDFTAGLDDAKNQGVTADYLKDYDGYMRFVIELPSKVIESNGEESKDGKHIEWDLFELGDGRIEATFTLKGGKAFPSETTITVKKEKTADIELVFDEMENDDQRDEMEELDWDLSGKSKVTAVKEGVKLEDLQDELNDLEMGFESFELDYNKKDDVYTIEWEAPQEDAEFVLELPNEAEDSNSDSEGKTLEWDLSEMDEPISAEFKVKSGGVSMVLVVYVFALFFALLVLMRHI